ncbi:MAG: hypothetical protein HZC54_07900 [Verrucomicrobia bacterium]|nr:hypothetical protein [Verrucomicrobiota bacterium]
MNRDAVLFHLREAKEELDRTIGEIENDQSYDYAEFHVAMSHLYHHLNTAWNGRDASAERHRECIQSDFDAWRKFSSDADLLLNNDDA